MISLPQLPDCSMYENALEQITMQDERIARVLLEVARIDRNIINSPALYAALERQGAISRDTAREVVEGMLAAPTSQFDVRGRTLDTVSFSFRDPNFKRYILIRNAALPAS